MAINSKENFVFTFVGNGMPYVPVEKSIVAVNLVKIRRVRNLAFKSTGSTDGEIHLMSKIINFEKEIQRVVDQPGKVSGMCCRLLVLIDQHEAAISTRHIQSVLVFNHFKKIIITCSLAQFSYSSFIQTFCFSKQGL